MLRGSFRVDNAMTAAEALTQLLETFETAFEGEWEEVACPVLQHDDAKGGKR